MKKNAVVNIHEAKTQLSKLVERATRGEAFVIAKAGTPMVKVAPVGAPATPRRLGFLAGEISVPRDFDRMGEKEIAALFGPGRVKLLLDGQRRYAAAASQGSIRSSARGAGALRGRDAADRRRETGSLSGSGAQGVRWPRRVSGQTLHRSPFAHLNASCARGLPAFAEAFSCQPRQRVSRSAGRSARPLRFAAIKIPATG